MTVFPFQQYQEADICQKCQFIFIYSQTNTINLQQLQHVAASYLVCCTYL